VTASRHINEKKNASAAPAPTGYRFGDWRVVHPAFVRPKGYKSLICRCMNCGAMKLVDWNNLKKGVSKGCTRCHAREMVDAYLEPWQRQVAEVLDAARRRCQDPGCREYPNYGGRGIEFRFPSIRAGVSWIEVNLGPRPLGLELDRTDNNWHYESGNLRWATRKTQMANRRNSIPPLPPHPFTAQAAAKMYRRGLRTAEDFRREAELLVQKKYRTWGRLAAWLECTTS
jgi:hypothetical protein